MKRIQTQITAIQKIQLMMALVFCISLPSFTANAQQVNKNYDEKLAKELKADDYGMKRYILVILKTGTATNLPKVMQDSIFKGHMANINKLAAEGTLIVAGPLGKNDKSYRGIFIFDVDNIEAARKLVNTDPVITSKLMDAEYFPWYGSAALKETLKIHSKIEKQSH